MNCDEVIAKLRAHEGELRAMGVTSLSVFGSVARGEAGPDSDVDVAVTLDRERGVDLYDLAGIQMRLAEFLGQHVDVVTEPARRERFRRALERDRIHAF